MIRAQRTTKPKKRGRVKLKENATVEEMYKLEDDIKIDPDQLDIMFLENSSLIFKWSKLEALAKKELQEKELELRVLRSEIILEIKEGGTKYTVQEQEAKYRIDPRYIEKHKEVNEAQYNINILEAAKWAFKHRHTDIQELVKLAAMEYFNTPDAPRDLKAEIFQRQKEREDKLRSLITKNTGE